ncbi:MAG: hypothetical protein JKY19_02415, partial [Alcanivoracaceae bacterium]|nr:hypothetical protein [Alcanivoracaceae bacterium]
MLTGNNFSPTPGSVPTVSVNRLGGGLITAAVVSFSNQQIDFIYPAGATSSVISVTVNGETVSSVQTFTTI